MEKEFTNEMLNEQINKNSDDAAVFAFVWSMVEDDVEEYKMADKKWGKGN